MILIKRAKIPRKSLKDRKTPQNMGCIFSENAITWVLYPRLIWPQGQIQ